MIDSPDPTSEPADPTAPQPEPNSAAGVAILLGWIIGALSLSVVLLYHNIADGDMWARLAAGAPIWSGHMPFERDPFAFTPILEYWIDHEWGAGVIFFGALKFFGPDGLFALKIILALGALASAIGCARRLGVRWEVLLLLAMPAGAAMIPGYVPVIRSHALTYAFFGLTLLLLETMRQSEGRWPLICAGLFVPLTIIWANSHGGFVSGLGIFGVYGLHAIWRRDRAILFCAALGVCALSTLINPYGTDYWRYLLPALLHDRPEIPEWQPLPLFARDSFFWFRVLFVVTVLVVITGWRDAKEKRSLPGLVTLALTAYLAWSSRRHAPFFALATLAFAGPFYEALMLRTWRALQEFSKSQLSPAVMAAILHGGLFFYVWSAFSPGIDLRVAAPVGFYPVREADILMYSGAEGNLAVPFRWGSYALWRLYPEIKVSNDGRYEETYPESTFDMNNDFFLMRGDDWDRLVTEHPVDFIMVDLKISPLQPEHLAPLGFELVYYDEGGQSALFVKRERADEFASFIANDLPDSTIEPLDVGLMEDWEMEN